MQKQTRQPAVTSSNSKSVLLAAHLLYLKGELVKAWTLLDDLGMRTALDPEIQNFIGNIKMQLGDWEDALHHYSLSIAASPNVEAYSQRGHLQMRMGNFEAAARDLWKAIELDGGQNHAAAVMARYHWKIVCSAMRFIHPRKEAAALQQVATAA